MFERLKKWFEKRAQKKIERERERKMYRYLMYYRIISSQKGWTLPVSEGRQPSSQPFREE